MSCCNLKFIKSFIFYEELTQISQTELNFAKFCYSFVIREDFLLLQFFNCVIQSYVRGGANLLIFGPALFTHIQYVTTRQKTRKYFTLFESNAYTNSNKGRVHQMFFFCRGKFASMFLKTFSERRGLIFRQFYAVKMERF